MVRLIIKNLGGMRLPVLSTVVLLVCLLAPSCYYDIEEDLYPDTGCNVADVGYSNTVVPILENNCYRCHDAANNFGGITVEGYAQLKKYVDNGQLLGVLNHEAGFSPMPKNAPQLRSCDIEKIEAWVNNGALNN